MPAANPLFAIIRGELLPYSHASLHVSDLAIQRGYGIFDYFRVHRGRVLFLPDYLDRFYSSAELMHLPVPYTRPELEALIYQLIDRNQVPESGIKMILTGGYSEDGYVPGDPNLILVQQPLSLPGPEVVHRGIRIITHEYIREIPLAKTIHYAMGIRLLSRIREEGAADVLYHQGGVVSELPRSNFFIVRADDTLVTPGEGVLAGITRQKVLELAAGKYRVEEGPVTLADIARAKEAFLTSTTRRLLPVVQVDHQVIGQGQPGPVTRNLLADWLALEDQAG